MGWILTSLEITAVLSGIATPVVYRRMFGGPWRTSKDDFLLEFSGLMLSMMVTNPVALLASLALSSFFVLFSETALYIYLLILNVILGIVGGWVWIVVFVRPIKPADPKPPSS